MTAELLQTIGRVVFGGFFLVAAIRNFRNFGDGAGRKTNYGWPLPPPLMAAGFAVQGLAGLSLILDIWTVCGAAVLIGFLCLATPLYHNPFMFEARERGPHLYLTLVNITLAAGLLMVIAASLA